MDKEQIQEILNICEAHLENLKNNLDGKEKLETILEEALEQVSQAIDEAQNRGEDMTNETNWYTRLIDEQRNLY
ncbi:hypothetical protein [endosymbiont GvMRE of Glomus versiforme]|uniref:hypothetical protein n=1 Tax=endosymbiont GvMRE of Glomus versiforme TaxID=2039283 RepID=UPI000EC18E34|nr:hypothetical protein [endosymbiont GvMRE of Glomus versiforme]RHZ36067.1 hypothetical protein GvMRE_Ic3g146 [endosymbiont GvMRE of Glomus versiforme]RHZ37409.1 hypothetical protein GvMRE_I1g422 [endosymbiont GvMRE of Glomus versiforme]